ncbi:Uncharacterised protein [Pseudomonas luteola]|uniref:Conjugal transfer protein n=1 Tax=Pseudomonas luteola TaxID=47886 RepID=A0A2X2C8V9_PSELU|nr:hypothetical protein [Pseudomonas luteola]SPZ04952.1 Uncharacterised protein [Pseudomonas luteola]
MRLKQIAVVACATVLPFSFSGPAQASSDSALLSAILKQAIAQLLQQQTINTTIDGGLEEVRTEVEQSSKRAATAIMNGQIDIYNQQNQKDQQASTFCQEEQTLPTKISKATVQKAYSRQSTSYNDFNSAQATHEPAKFTREKNEQVLKNITSTCDVRILPPVGKKDVSNNMACTDDQVKVITDVATGRKPLPQPPAAFKNTDIGETLKREIDTYNLRMSAVENVIGTSVSEERDAELTAYEKLFASPTIDEINAMSGTGGVSRDALVMQQLNNQLLLRLYKETIESNRLAAIQISQREEQHRREISQLLSNSGRQ